MSNEDRQRVIRRAGFEPAEAETQDRARKSRQAKAEEEAELQRRAPEGGTEAEPSPLAEDAEGPPRPRR